MSRGAGRTITILMKYNKGDIVLISSAAGPAIPHVQVRLIQRVVVKPSKGRTLDWPGYVGWECELIKESDAKKLKKNWGIPFNFPDQIETFTLEANIVKIIRRKKQR